MSLIMNDDFTISNSGKMQNPTPNIKMALAVLFGLDLSDIALCSLT